MTLGSRPHMSALTLYESLAANSVAMLDAARRGDWNTVVEIEAECSQAIAQLHKDGDPVPIEPTEREHKARLIRRLLADDAEIRGLAQPHLEALGRLLNAGSVRDRIERTYG